MEDLRNIAMAILERGHLMSLATQDEGGLWVSDVVYVFDDEFNLYWMSDPDVRHSKAIRSNSRVAGTITVSNKSKEPNLCLQFAGEAMEIRGPRYDLAIKHLAKRNHPIPKESDDILQGDSWYMLKPQFMDVIHEELWGYDKKKLEF